MKVAPWRKSIPKWLIHLPADQTQKSNDHMSVISGK